MFDVLVQNRRGSVNTRGKTNDNTIRVLTL